MKYWQVATVWAWEDAIKWMTLTVLGLALLGIELGLGTSYMNSPDGLDIAFWVFGGLSLTASLPMRPLGAFTIVFWGYGLALLAVGFFGGLALVIVCAILLLLTGALVTITDEDFEISQT